MYTKKNGRMTYKSNRRPNFKRNNNFSSKNRNKGNVTQQYNKYLKLAKESFRSGDRVQSEYYYQFTDHYYRLMIELGINVEDNTQSDEVVKSSSDDQTSEEISSPETPSLNENQETNTNDESIESIPFIAEPSKDKRSRSSK